MTTVTDVANLAFQAIGTRTTIASLGEDSNEAIQASLIIYKLRDTLLRMAPWDCALNFNLLNYITSTPGTPENPTVGQVNWSKGLPAPPWAYEYQYPVDCIRACWIVPQFQTGFSSGIPITTAVTGGAPNFWNGPPVRFKIGIDQFYAITAAVIATGGLGYAVSDEITLAITPDGDAPIGAPGVLRVATIGVGGAVATVTIVNQLQQSQPENSQPQTGSYFALPTNPIAQSDTTGTGSGATFTCTFSAQGDQRVVLTNQEDAVLAYVKQVTDPNVMDELFIQAWSTLLGSRLVFQLTGDKALANAKISETNTYIMEARKADGNEGLTINDVTPDFIRIRGIAYPSQGYSGINQFDWGGMFTPY